MSDVWTPEKFGATLAVIFRRSATDAVFSVDGTAVENARGAALPNPGDCAPPSVQNGNRAGRPERRSSRHRGSLWPMMWWPTAGSVRQAPGRALAQDKTAPLGIQLDEPAFAATRFDRQCRTKRRGQ